MSGRDIIDTILIQLGWARRSYREDAEAILAALRERYAIVELPEPHSVTEATDDENGRKEWAYPHGKVTVFDDGEIHWGNWSSLRPQKVRQAAAALLAAADAAEADQ